MFEQTDQRRIAPLRVKCTDTGKSVAEIDKNFLKAPGLTEKWQGAG
jgi:hypothetical protein